MKTEFTIKDKSGKEIICQGLFSFYSEEFDKDYVVFYIDNESELILASYLPDTEPIQLFPVENKKELEYAELEVKQLMENDNAKD